MIHNTISLPEGGDSPKGLKTRNIYIVDDDGLMRRWLYESFLDSEGSVIRGFPSGESFLESLDELSPGCVLLDNQMPGREGIEVLESIADLSRFAIVLMTAQGTIDIAVRALKLGAVDFIEKPFDREDMLAAVERAFDRLNAKYAEAGRLEAARAKLALLSARERDVLNGLVAGQSNKVIAYELDISPRTVEIYRANVMDKFEVRSLSQALGIAFTAGMRGE